MRALGLILLLSAPAAADPPRQKLPDIVNEALAHGAIVEREGVVGMDGALAAGVAIELPPHPDMRPAPYGFWFKPPDPNDPMVLEPGTNQLRARERREAWLPRDLSLQLKHGADKVWDVLLPKL